MRRDIRIALGYGVAFCAIGAVASWKITDHYADIAKSEAVQAAIETATKEGRESGLAQGLVEAQKAWDAATPQILEERIPSIVETIRNTSFKAGEGEGYSRGLSEGEKKGYDIGLNEGISRANASANRISIAEKNWGVYWANLRSLRDLAEKGGDKNTLVGEASALISSASQLKNSYVEQSTSFNSLVQDLEKALEIRNFPEIRRLAIALEASAEIKGGVFIESVKTQEQAFSELEERVTQ